MTTHSLPNVTTDTLPVGPIVYFNLSTNVARVACTGALVSVTQNMDEAYAAMARITTDAVRYATGIVGLDMMGYFMLDGDIVVILDHVNRAATPDWAEVLGSARRLTMEVVVISGSPDERYDRSEAIGTLYNSTQRPETCHVRR